jgi:hypothetical protein
MTTRDTRPKWLLRKQARISQRRLGRFGVRADKLDPPTWWSQIGDAAAELGLDAGAWEDWQSWPVEPAPADDGGELL